MLSEEIKELFEELVDDNTMDATVVYHLMTAAKDEIEYDRAWEYLKAFDTSITVSSSGSYLTANSLPALFREPLSVRVGSSRQEHLQIPLEQREMFKDTAHRYYLDMANNNIHICGNVGSDSTLYLAYVANTPDLGAGVTPSMPARFHKLIAYQMAKMFYAAEAGEKGRSWDDRWKVFYEELRMQMVHWDARLKIKATQNVGMSLDFSADPNIVSDY